MNLRKRKFSIPVHGRFPRESVLVHDSDERMMMTPKLKNLIGEIWEEKETHLTKKKGFLFPGSLCRLIRYDLTENELHLYLGRTHFNELLATNLGHPIIHKVLGEEYMSNGLAVRTVIRTADEKIIIGQRSEKVAEAAGYYHLCGGYIDPAKHRTEDGPDPYHAIESFMNEELGIPQSAIRHLMCLGLAIDVKTLKPELMFEAEIDLSFRKVLHQMAKAPRDTAHSEIFGIMAVRASLRGFLAANRRKIAATAQGCLWIYGVERGYWAAEKRGIIQKYVGKKWRKKESELLEKSGN